jgi:hypothetical protein
MCFSASASFTATVLLFVLGAVGLYKTNRRTWMLSSIPCIFAVQQAAEGVVWVGMNRDLPSMVFVATYAFMFFAFILWPTWICWSLYRIENNEIRKKLLYGASLAGFFVSAFLAIALMVTPVQTSVIDHHIAYSIGRSHHYITSMVYLLVTAGPFFLSSYVVLWVPGMLLCVSWLITMLIWQQAFISLWCFYAALISVLIPFVKNQIQSTHAT